MGRPTNAEREAKLKAEAPLTADDRFKALEAHCQKLEAVISRLAVNTGNGNWLREFGIERWQPGKEHMGKKYA